MRTQEPRNWNREPTLPISRLTRLAVMALLVSGGAARAAELCWTNATGGNWSVAGNWNPNQVPGGADHAYLTNNGSYTVTVSANTAVNLLTLGGDTGTQTLELSGGTLTLSGSGTGNAQAVLSIKGGTLA